MSSHRTNTRGGEQTIFSLFMKFIILSLPFALAGLVFTAFFSLLTGLILMLLWNWLMPALFELPEVTYKQAYGLVFLCSILFNRGSGGVSTSSS